ncbi:glycosyltransferase family 4 protein [Cecembia calidifontis]|uniref:Glycosyltransferase involved in cell wall biosynthesis n=1 Tax=Cecembia calidifontis TaxID=1187080 RepID=A0A4Q7P611_9BACT|nr:glycosyltransferase family 1 protein [Cecembia calidifontis]RZS95197.1 glycosyltransferase involved in cell wall biosynthesis [Cecembia calidifontis]
MRKKRIYVDLFYLNTALTGIKTYMLEFCEAVNAQASEDFQYIFSHEPKKQSESGFFRGNVPYWRKIAYHFYYFLWKQLFLPIQVKKNKADVLLCFDYIAPAMPLKAKKLVVVHDAFFWQMPQNYNRYWRKYFIPMLHAGLKGNCTVITTSEYAKKAIVQFTGIKNPIEVIYQCPRLLPEKGDEKVLEILGIQSKAYFLHVGSFDKRKLLPVLVKAFSIIEREYPGKFKLVLVGERGLSSALDDYDRVKKTIADSDLEGKVLLPGFLKDPEVKSLYDAAFAYVFPSSNEGFGIPVIEAMRSGIPVIISEQQALTEVAGGAALSHPIGDIQSMARCMKQLIQSEDLVQKLIGLGKVRSEDFSRSTFIKKYEKLF